MCWTFTASSTGYKTMTTEGRNMTDTNTLQRHVDQIAESLTRGITYREAEIDHTEYDADPDFLISGFDYLEDALDIEYTFNANGQYLGARILVAFGGPNIWVDTRHCTVEGHWWGESAKADFMDSIGLLDSCEELARMYFERGDIPCFEDRSA